MANTAKINLGIRYSIVISGAIFIIVVVLSVLQLIQYQNTADQLRQVSSDSMRDNLVNEIRQRGESVGAVLVERLVNPVYRLDMLQMYELIDETARLRGVSYVYLVDTESGPAGFSRPDGVDAERASRREQLLHPLRNRFPQESILANYGQAQEEALDLAGILDPVAGCAGRR